MVNFKTLLASLYTKFSAILKANSFTTSVKSLCKATLKGLVDRRTKISNRLSKDEIDKKKKGKKPSLLNVCAHIGNSAQNLVTRICRWKHCKTKDLEGSCG